MRSCDGRQRCEMRFRQAKKHSPPWHHTVDAMGLVCRMGREGGKRKDETTASLLILTGHKVSSSLAQI